MKNCRKHSIVLAVFVAFAGWAVMFINCSQSNMAGGVEVGNPVTVLGTVVDYLQKPVSNAKVMLLRPAFIPVRDSADTVAYQAFTGPDGGFCIKNIRQGMYNLNVADAASGTIALRSDIALYNDAALLPVTLHKPGVGAVSIADSVFHPSSFLYVSGTPVYLPIPGPGIYLFPAPYDTVCIRYYSMQTGADIPLYGNATDAVYITPQDTVDLTGIENYIIAPVLYVEYDTVKYPLPFTDTITTDQDVYIYAEGAYSNKNHPLEFQFYFRLPGSDTGFSAWSVGNYSMINDSVDIVWLIGSRARSRVDNAIVSGWSREYTVVIDRRRKNTERIDLE